MALSQPNTTLYINNLNDKVNKEELRLQLYALFTTYGKVIDVVASKSPKMRGQAFLVFTDLAAATTAMRACEGMAFYDKPMVRLVPFVTIHAEINKTIQRITYAKSKSYATSRREDPKFVPPTSVHARPELSQIGKLTVSSADKRQRDDDTTDDHPNAKREKSQEDSSDEEMEIDEDEENVQNVKPLGMHDCRGVHRNSPLILQRNHACTCTTAVCTSAMYEFTTGSD